ncbi:hypothetical protein C0Q70_21332 [Pomacea canaliculata]|uniref:Uncharacterized protein n=1 Tax=Pomacea canaliculata TaxID=400727 RepID=A0A2T7NC80_POMCA|nr:hypothetical protein C0Q70_21332 [Pomacea canaliculata]
MLLAAGSGLACSPRVLAVALGHGSLQTGGVFAGRPWGQDRAMYSSGVQLVVRQRPASDPSTLSLAPDIVEPRESLVRSY